MNNQQSATGVALRWSGHTDRGRVRKNNEDTFLALSINNREVYYLGKIGEGIIHANDYLFAVSDGMGGAMAGEFASRITVEKITRMFPSFLKRMAHSQEETKEDAVHQLLKELFTEIHRALLFLGSSYDECQGMGATLSLCWFRSDRIYFAHIGDSRIYHLPQTGGIQQLSEDDTHVGWLFRQGTLSERETKNHPRRSCLQKALGADYQFITPQVGSFSFHPGDRILLCTDGVTEEVFDNQLIDILASHKDKSPSQHLVEEVVMRSGRDNSTAMVIEVDTFNSSCIFRSIDA
ncbi:MAG: hypothetical protein A3F67_05220 [Verrucomicrobia bacterium RIFCSPHIGHO2_12_FULL_41_10]|nr:MAG: hypothetical protein A3F67_05220 [Verrucomicrobia bacterium RIFCSPHIGHO2_12_FULL_41_10]